MATKRDVINNVAAHDQFVSKNDKSSESIEKTSDCKNPKKVRVSVIFFVGRREDNTTL